MDPRPPPQCANLANSPPRRTVRSDTPTAPSVIVAPVWAVALEASVRLARLGGRSAARESVPVGEARSAQATGSSAAAAGSCSVVEAQNASTTVASKWVPACATSCSSAVAPPSERR